MLTRFIIAIVLLLSFMTVYAGGTGLLLTKFQQSRLNGIVKQLKIPLGEYKLTVQSSGATIENLIMPTPEIQVVEKEKIVTETKTIEVPKEVIKEVLVEKILTDPRVVTGSIVLSPSDIERIRYCGVNYPRETIDYQARRGQCIVRVFYEVGGIYNSDP